MPLYLLTAITLVLALLAGAVLLARVVLARTPGFRLHDHGARLSGDAWRRDFRSDWNRPLGLTLALGAALAVVIGLVLAATAPALQPPPSAGELLLRPTVLVWLLPGLLLAVPLTLELGDWLRRRLVGRERALELREARNRWRGYRTGRASALTGMLAAVAGLAIALLMADWHLHVGTDRLAVDPLARREARPYAFAQVAAVEHLQSRRTVTGQIARGDFWRIEFADGRAWESWRAMTAMTPAELEQAMKLVAQRAGRAVRSHDPFPEQFTQ